MSRTDMDARDRAGQIAHEIWLDLWPHDDALTARPHLRQRDADQPAPEYRLTPLQSVKEAKPGDLLWVRDLDGRDFRRAYTLSTHTAREAVREGYVVQVVSVTAKSLQVYDLVQCPKGGWGGANLEALGDPRFPTPDTTVMRFGTSGRLYARLGAVEEIRERLAAHPRYAEWSEAYAAGKAEQEEAEARRKALVEDVAARRAPLLAAVETVNEIAGEELLRLGERWAQPAYEVGEVKIVSDWLAEGDRLRVHLAGLAALKRITSKEHQEALDHLTTLGIKHDTNEGEQ